MFARPASLAFVAVLLASVGGCVPAPEAADIPGLYVSGPNNVQEQIWLRQDGSFSHRWGAGGEFVESGRWTLDGREPGCLRITLAGFTRLRRGEDHASRVAFFSSCVERHAVGGIGLVLDAEGETVLRKSER
ncbi:MAG: hypothetical protein IT546_12335 [Caulobacteraceae bacterium]|nr:hypothetical protein [Caulobacteraceae bacterium]